MTLTDLTGKKFGYWTVLKVAPYAKNTPPLWLCECRCGTKKTVMGFHLRSGQSKSCGCRVPERNRELKTTHGHATNGRTKTYRSWESAKGRCVNPSRKYYFGRGIHMCKEWFDDFNAFFRDMGPRPSGKTLDRYPNNDGNYEPGNCRWATYKQQARNRRKP